MAVWETSGAAAMPSSQRVLCTAMYDSTRHTYIYHAEFNEGNGLSSGNTNWVLGASLFLNLTGGTAGATSFVGASYSFPKWSGTRVIVDFACWDGN